MTNEEAIGRLQAQYCVECRVKNCKYCEMYVAISAIKSQRTGKWKRVPLQSFEGIGWRCSLCNYGVKAWNNTLYCPRCGAKMEDGV